MESLTRKYDVYCQDILKASFPHELRWLLNCLHIRSVSFPVVVADPGVSPGIYKYDGNTCHGNTHL